MIEKPNACAHGSCKCRVAEEGEFCSEYCREAREINELGCGCEHTRCIHEL